LKNVSFDGLIVRSSKLFLDDRDWYRITAKNARKRQTMTIAILLYIALSLLALLILYGACLAAAHADRAINEKKRRLHTKAQSQKPVDTEHSQTSNAAPHRQNT
jgi:hypothetical protein